MDFYPVKFTPIPKERIWGGHTLKKRFGYEGKEPIGEYWVLSSHPNGMSVVSDGPFKGMTLQELTDTYPEQYLGNSPQKRFPLLIKFLDITKDLSVQVHPDDNYAKKHENDFGKTECWYILETKEDSSVVYGHHFKNKENYIQAVNEGRVEEYLNTLPINPHDTILVPSRTLHALLADTILIEIQQTSDVTYRVYDWNRKDKDGNTRALHVEKAGEVLTYEETAKYEIQETKVTYFSDSVQHEEIIRCPYFTVERIRILKGEHTLPIDEVKNPMILVFVKGEGNLHYLSQTYSLYPGDTIMCPSIHSIIIECNSELVLLRISY